MRLGPFYIKRLTQSGIWLRDVQKLKEEHLLEIDNLAIGTSVIEFLNQKLLEKRARNKRNADLLSSLNINVG